MLEEKCVVAEDCSGPVAGLYSIYYHCNDQARIAEKIILLYGNMILQHGTFPHYRSYLDLEPAQRW